MGRSILPLVVAVLVLSAAREARGAGEITVARGEGAEGCPDAAELARIANASHLPAPTTHVYRVAFARADAVFQAEIADETTKRVRTLIDHGADCAPLGEAVAVVLATMWSSERAEEAPEPVVEPPAPTPPVTRREEVIPSAQPARTHWIAGAGFGLATGLVRAVAPVLVGDVAFERSPFGVALGAHWIPSQNLRLGPGVVHVQLIAASMRGCGFLGRETRGEVRLGICARFFAGALDARGSGYDADSHRARPWLAAGAEIFIGGALPMTMVRYRASLDAIVPVHAEAFSVAGIGTAYETPGVGGLFTVSVEIGTR